MEGMFRIGSRGSRLAMVQSESVKKYLEQKGIPAQIVPIRTKGDRILDRPLELVGGKGLFVKELEAALRDGRIDISVHSLKDVPARVPEDLPLIGFSRREDPRDALVLPAGETELTKDKPIGCSSRRRVLQAKRLFPDMEFASVRGNVLTRLQKLDEGQFGGLILAAAGLNRLGLSGRISRYFTVDEMIPSAGQGILALQGRADREYPELWDYCDDEAAVAAACERAAICCLAGDCTAPVAAYAQVDGRELVVRGMYGGDGGAAVRGMCGGDGEPVVCGIYGGDGEPMMHGMHGGDGEPAVHGMYGGDGEPVVYGSSQEKKDRSGFVTACVRGSREQPEKLGTELAEVLLRNYSDCVASE